MKVVDRLVIIKSDNSELDVQTNLEQLENKKIDSSSVSNIGKTGKLSDGQEDSTHRLVTDAEKTSWGNKIDSSEKDTENAGDSMAAASSSQKGKVVVRNNNGNVIVAGTITNNYEATSKKYVDDLVDSVSKKLPTFSFDSASGTLTITDNS